MITGAPRNFTPRVAADDDGWAATRRGGEVIELEHGITVYPARSEGALARLPHPTRSR